MHTKPDLWQRLLAGGALVILFMTMASIISPKTGTASQRNGNNSSSADAITQPKNNSTKYIGELVGNEYRIRIHADYPEPTYSIFSMDGEILAQNLSRQDAVLQYPTIPIGIFGINANQHDAETGIDIQMEVDNLGLVYPDN